MNPFFLSSSKVCKIDRLTNAALIKGIQERAVIILREGRVDLSSKYFLKRSRIKRTLLKNWLDPSHGLNIVKGRAIFSGTCPKIYDFFKNF
jgi:hypothetical protein